MLKYPPYDSSEYNCLKCPEAATDFYLRLEELENNRADLDLQRKELEDRSKSSLLAIKEAVVADISRFLGDQDPERRRNQLGRLLPNLKTCLERGPGLMRARLRSASLEVLRHYATLDVEVFQQDIDTFIEDTDDGKSLRDSLRKLDGRRGYAESQITNHWKGYESLFHQVPIAWRDWKFAVSTAEGPEKETAVAKERRNMAERIIRTFVRDWKERAVFFEDPMTVTGVAIHSLPDEKRRTWLAAYDKLGLRSLPKRPYFQAIMLPQRPKTKDKPAAVNNPMFTPTPPVKETADAEVA